MKNFVFEFDCEKGFDVISVKTNKVVEHFETYEEAVARQKGHDNLYIRYFAKKPCIESPAKAA